MLAKWGCVGARCAGWEIENRQVWGRGVRGTRAPPGFWVRSRCSQSAKWGVVPTGGGEMRPKWAAGGERGAKSGFGGGEESSGNDLPDE